MESSELLEWHFWWNGGGGRKWKEERKELFGFLEWNALRKSSGLGWEIRVTEEECAPRGKKMKIGDKMTFYTIYPVFVLFFIQENV